MKNITFALTACMLLNSLSALSQPGTLDTSFSGNGKRTKPPGRGYAVAIQPDGKILVAGSQTNGFSANLMVARYEPNGSFDESFGKKGKAIIDFGGYAEAYSITLQGNGKIVTAGTLMEDFAVVRFKRDGSLDSNFGVNGKVTTDFEGKRDEAKFVAIQPDNKILVIGTAFDSGGEQSKIALARYNPNGTLDNGFGKGGKVATTVTEVKFDYGSAFILQPDGKIVAAGYSYGINTQFDFTLVRYQPNGKVDSSFGTNGFAITDFNGYDLATAIGVQQNGKMIVAGYSDFFNSVIDLARYTKNGLLDSSFGTKGKVITSVGGISDQVHSMAIQPDNKIVIAGSSVNGPNTDFVLVRYKPNGNIDKSFGNNGIVLTDFKNYDYAQAVTLQPDGKIVAVGLSGTQETDVALARYNADDVLHNMNNEKISIAKNINDDFENATVRICPNPFQSTLNIKFKSAQKTKKIINVYDMRGSLLYTTSTIESTRLNLRPLVYGSYFIKITDENGKELYSEKMIKQ